MRPLLRYALALLVLACAPTVALATNVIVPDAYTTIQAAIDSGADTVFVRAGTYPESLSVGAGQSLIAMTTAMPYVTSLRSNYSVAMVRGFRIRDRVTIHGGDIDGCWLETGLSWGSGNGSILHNVIFGDVSGGMGLFDFAMNTILNGTLDYNPVGSRNIHDNVVVGPAPVGIVVWSDASAVHNYVRGCVTGIENHTEFSVSAGNVVEDCSGTGIVCSGSYAMGASNNTVRRCGGVGIDVTIGGASGTDVTGNTVDSVGSIGIRVTGGTARLSGNTVRSAGGDGVLAVPAAPSTITGNVVGRSAGRGLVVQNTAETILTSNTSYANAAAGYDVTAAWHTTIHDNIAYGNGGYGLVWGGTGTLDLACNDWCENDAGPVSGAAPGATDVNLNPLFCDMPADNVYLGSASPLLALGDCALVGALGQGCTEPLAGVPAGAPQIFSFQAGPNPTRGTVEFSWPASASPGRVDVYDVTGAHRWGADIEAGRTALVWQGSDHTGRRLPAGVYYARLKGAEALASARFVIVQ